MKIVENHFNRSLHLNYYDYHYLHLPNHLYHSLNLHQSPVHLFPADLLGHFASLTHKPNVMGSL